MLVQALRFKFHVREHNYEQLPLRAFEVTSSYKATHTHTHTQTHASTHEKKRTYNCGLQSN